MHAPPLIWFKPTLEHYSELWLDKVPDNFSALAFGLLAIILVLVLISGFCKTPTRFASGHQLANFGGARADPVGYSLAREDRRVL